MSDEAPAGSPRRRELLEGAYAHVAAQGTAEVALRPLAAAIGSSPRVLLYLFGSKDGLVRELLARAREDECRVLADAASEDADLATVLERLWAWLVAAEHRATSALWLDAYARSLTDESGPWAGFADRTVADWLAMLSTAQPADRRDSSSALAERTLALTVLRGALLDLLATGDAVRTSAAVRLHVAGVRAAAMPSGT